MKIRLFAATFGALLAAGPALADPWDFMLQNMTGRAITKLEVAPAGSGTWTDNIVDPELRKDPGVKAGGKTTVHFERGQACKYDLRATFDDKSTMVWSTINICDNSYVTISVNGDKPLFKAS